MSRYNELLSRDNTNNQDRERKALFYILGGNDDLYSKINHIYDFKEHSIEPDCLESSDVDFSGGSIALIRLAFNLFNGYRDEKTDVMSVLSSLDTDNFELAMKAIQIRLSRL